MAEFARLLDRGARDKVLLDMANAMIELTTCALESGLPQHMSTLREHLTAVALAAEKEELQRTDGLWNNLASYQQVLADYKGAKKLFERALKIDEQVYGKDHPSVAIRVNNLGLVLHDKGELQKARKCFERAQNIFRDRLGEDHPSTRIVAGNLNSVKQG